MKTTFRWALPAVLATSLLAGALLPAQEPAPQPSAAMRAKMAEVHDKMAQCLRSTRSVEECRAEMRAAHAQMGGDMMGPGTMGPGMKGQGMKGQGTGGPPKSDGCRMMQTPPAPATTAEHAH